MSKTKEVEVELKEAVRRIRLMDNTAIDLSKYKREVALVVDNKEDALTRQSFEALRWKEKYKTIPEILSATGFSRLRYKAIMDKAVLELKYVCLRTELEELTDEERVNMLTVGDIYPILDTQGYEPDDRIIYVYYNVVRVGYVSAVDKDVIGWVSSFLDTVLKSKHNNPFLNLSISALKTIPNRYEEVHIITEKVKNKYDYGVLLFRQNAAPTSTVDNNVDTTTIPMVSKEEAVAVVAQAIGSTGSSKEWENKIPERDINSPAKFFWDIKRINHEISAIGGGSWFRAKGMTLSDFELEMIYQITPDLTKVDFRILQLFGTGLRWAEIQCLAENVYKVNMDESISGIKEKLVKSLLTLTKEKTLNNVWVSPKDMGLDEYDHLLEFVQGNVGFINNVLKDYNLETIEVYLLNRTLKGSGIEGVQYSRLEIGKEKLEVADIKRMFGFICCRLLKFLNKIKAEDTYMEEK